jgi:hypothetical protein
MTQILENMIELQKSARPFATEANIHTKEHAFVCIESKSKTVRSFEFVQFDVVHMFKHVAGIAEERHIQAGECLPSVLEVEHDGLLASKPEFPESPKVFRAAKSRQQIERNLLSWVRVS